MRSLELKTTLVRASAIVSLCISAACGGSDPPKIADKGSGSGEAGADECLVGTQGCPCYGNHTCDLGLQCAQDTCGTAAGQGGDGGAPSDQPAVGGSAGRRGDEPTTGGSGQSGAGDDPAHAAGAGATPEGTGGSGVEPGSGGRHNTGGSGGRDTTGGSGGTSGSGGSAGNAGGEPTAGAPSTSCFVGNRRSCAEAGFVGDCASGVQRCGSDGTWGECSVLPEASDSCTAGHDEDCDGTPNEGCDCSDGALQACGPATRVGVCERGVSHCTDGSWGPCEGATYPQTRDCGSSDDHDCDGVADDTLDDVCVCAAGDTASCGEHPEDGWGVCHAGTSTCRVSGNGSTTRWGECKGAVGPSPELCADDGRDEDCDGTVNEAEVCDHVPAIAIAAGTEHSCALLEDHTVRCWGGNLGGELGRSGDGSPTPVAVSYVSGTQIDSSHQFTCVVTTDARGDCWGLDSGEDHRLGTKVAFANVIGIGAGESHGCALVYGGTVRCWGNGENGRLGFSTPWLNESNWVPVLNFSTATQLSVGSEHSCARLEDGTARCWGYNHDGQVGNGTTSDVDAGEPVQELEDAIDISAGGYHSCAVLSDGTARCWGSNGFGQLGDGTTDSQPTATEVLGLEGAVDIEAGFSHTCAILEGGTVSCWGRNIAGQLGDGTTEDRYNVTPVPGLTNVTALASGAWHTCALLENGRVWCWGQNKDGELGDGTTEDSPEPVEVALP
jgi:alpha-tubulin suppressor-like RCC1 family protein